MAAGKKVYQGMSLVAGTLGGLAAGALFKRIWKAVRKEDEAPRSTDEQRSWREVLVASAGQGALTGLVKATVTRGGASAVRRITGTWPA